ncbi:MAG: glycosyltransferase [Methanospirillum sp.]|uniref:glycosyltransferase n=1 Tax=Methanospirillum sp. TaxID=45200 RepID=UPI00236FBD3A|nr:glycosyltransferase [Methanospirillum sp.]MDD1729894.1 glycosyltransferase [Methanospirillum sp.]
MTYAPIVLFVYNRPVHTRHTVETLQKNIHADKSDLIIFSDWAKDETSQKNVEEVREYLRLISGFKSITIILRERHYGLAESVISGISQVFEKYDAVIVMEDDLESSQFFLTFMNAALDYYKEQNRIYSISGYNYPITIPDDYPYDVYLSYRCGSWGWATWKDRWLKACWNINKNDSFFSDKKAQSEFKRGGNDMVGMLIDQIEGKIDSWAIRWSYTHYINHAYCVFPTNSKIKNIGNDGSGTHVDKTNYFDVAMDSGQSKFTFTNDMKVNNEIAKNFARIFEPSIRLKIKRLLSGRWIL